LEEGVGVGEIAARLDCTRDYIISVRRFEGLTPPSPTAQAVEMMEAGSTNEQVREALGLSAGNVRIIRSRMATRPARNGRERDPERSRMIAAKYAELRSIRKTARHFGIVATTVRAAVAHAKRLERVA
jgi:hypothetical protein